MPFLASMNDCPSFGLYFHSFVMGIFDLAKYIATVMPSSSAISGSCYQILGGTIPFSAENIAAVFPLGPNVVELCYHCSDKNKPLLQAIIATVLCNESLIVGLCYQRGGGIIFS